MNKEKLQGLFNKEWKISPLEKTMDIVRSFSLTEKTIFVIVSIVFIVSSLMLLYRVNNSFLTQVPDYGGSLTEGIIGSPRFINPVLSSSDIDKDLVSLIYSGLLKANSEGELVTDIAESYEISEDGLIYTFKIKDDITFHDGVKLTTDDIVYTIDRIQDVNIKSPKELNWYGVKTEKIDDYTIVFTLKQAYSPFIQNLTIGILPKHIWKDATPEEFPFSQYNTKAIGTGPYKIDSITYNDSGLPNTYHLVSFNKYSQGKPYITKLTIKSYSNEKSLIEAFKNGSIDSLHGISPKQLPDLKTKNDNVIVSPLPRIFGLFLNQNVATIFVNKEVRQALDMSAPKQQIVDEVLDGYGVVINSPIPVKEALKEIEPVDQEKNIEEARNLLIKNGWKQNEFGTFEKKDKTGTKKLAFSISTGNAPELKESAELLQQTWQELGAEVELKVYDISDLNQNIIKTRKYDSLLFGEIIGRDMDLYSFWHSSERNSPGLNIAMYTNLKADRALENIRKTNDESDKKKYFEDLNREIQNDIPAIFTYSPYFIYITPNKIQNISLGKISTPSERFRDVSEWYIETSNVWKIFKNND